jgi:type I restriction enzyme S subunit
MNVTTGGAISLADLKYVSSSEVDREARWIRDGDVLFNNTNTAQLVGKTAFYGLAEPRAFSNHMTRLRFRSDVVDARFAALGLLQRWREGYFEEHCNNHVSQASISSHALLQTPLAVPPLSEQRRIVAKVEALLSRQQSVHDRLRNVARVVEQFRKAVLLAACSGRLSGDEAIGSDLPSSWTVHQVSDFLEDARYGTSQKCDTNPVGGVPIVRIPNIARGILDLSDLKYAHVDPKELRSVMLEQGDIVVCRTNGSLDLIGKAAVIPKLGMPLGFASYLIRLRMRTSQLSARYMHLVLESPIGRRHIEDRARTTAGQFNLNLEILRSLPVPVPPIDTQREILRRVDNLLGSAELVAQRVRATADQRDRLTNAILAKAFRGELVPTEAELARQQGRDFEPASVLLERIRANGSGHDRARRPRRGTQLRMRLS